MADESNHSSQSPAVMVQAELLEKSFNPSTSAHIFVYNCGSTSSIEENHDAITEKNTLPDINQASSALVEANRKLQAPRRSKYKNFVCSKPIHSQKCTLWYELEIRLNTPYNPLTSIGRFHHYFVNPLYHWHGQNEQILVTSPLAQVGIREKGESTRKVINCGSHNYAGFYDLSDAELELHQKCLERLPIADASAVSFLHEKMVSELAKFFNAKSCFSSSTGYQSNMLGIPGIAEEGWLIVLDEKSHNSMYTGAYASRAGGIEKFKHNNMSELRKILQEARKENKYSDVLVMAEGVYSMDGTIPHLDVLYKLKQEYSFVLYVDEAHSFGSIGKTGRGVLELWNDEHPSNQLPPDLIDVRSATLSKAVGGLGGFVCVSSTRFDEGLSRQSKELQQRGGSLTTATILQTLRFLAQPQRLERNLRRLKDISKFCHEELERQGVHVYGHQNLNHLPMLPVFGGRSSKAAELSMVLRRKGLLAAPVSTPAVEVWESRVPVILSASYTDKDVNGIITAIVLASRQIGLSRRTGILSMRYSSSLEGDLKVLMVEKDEMIRSLSSIIQEQIRQLSVTKALDRAAIDAGIFAQRKYGIGSGNSRWVLGTFPPHLEVEEMMAKITKQPAALTYPDSGLGLMSTIAGLCRTIMKAKRHYFLLPSCLSPAAEDGLRIASKNSGTMCIRYADLETMTSLFVALGSSKHSYITLYLLAFQNGKPLDLLQLANRLRKGLGNSGRRCTLLLDVDKCSSHTLESLDAADLAEVRDMLSARLLISGSFCMMHGLPGGFLTGDATMIEELRYTSRCYMFTTSPMPFLMAMIKEALLLRLT